MSTTMRMPRRPIIIEGFIVALWCFFVAHSLMLFDFSEPSIRSGKDLLEAVESGPGAEWFGIYIGNKKIGVGSSDRVSGPKGIRLQERSHLRLRAFDQNRSITTITVAELGSDNKLRSFDFMLNADPATITVQGRVHGNVLSVSVDTAGEVRHETISVDEIPELSVTFKERVARMRPKVGDVIDIPYFDPATLSGKTLKVKVLATGKGVLNGEEVPTYTLEAAYHGFKTTAVVTMDGTTLEERGALGIRMVRESREQALEEGWDDDSPPVDVIALSAVPLSKPIPHARRTRFLDARLSGGGVELLLDKHGGGDGDGHVFVHVIPRSKWQTYLIPMKDERFRDALSSSVLVQADDPRIISTARSIVGETLKADEAAALLNSWVYKHLRKVPVMGVPSATEVLDLGRGDCNEHTVLFTALARALGIPTRMAAGVVYSENITGNPAFYYHAWPEIYLGAWVAIDPTFNQFPADATHIKLVEGELDAQLALMRVVGNLRIDVRESGGIGSHAEQEREAGVRKQ